MLKKFISIYLIANVIVIAWTSYQTISVRSGTPGEKSLLTVVYGDRRNSRHIISTKQGQGSDDTDASKTWKRGTFCYDFLIDTFNESLPICDSSVVTVSDQVKCYGNKLTRHMALCSFHNIALMPRGMKAAIPDDVKWYKPQNRAINFLQGTESSCNSLSIDSLKQKTDPRDFQIRLVEQLSEASRLPVSVCDIWINKTTIFHISNALHIYFRFLNLYSVHKALLDYKVEHEGEYVVMQIGNLGEHYRFPDFDRALFPGALTLNDFPDNVTVCFKQAVLAPRSYQSVPFRCKMDKEIRNHCLTCNGKALSGSPLQTFRKRVLKACNITDSKINSNASLVVISRQAYKRWTHDDPKKFQRVLQNEDEMVSKIHQVFPGVTVDVVHMECLPICEQVRYAVKADIMLGLHGAGLVHFWWLRDEARALELEPLFEVSNPSFRMLATLAGRTYQKLTVVGNSESPNMKVDISYILSYLQQHLKE